MSLGQGTKVLYTNQNNPNKNPYLVKHVQIRNKMYINSEGV